MSPFNNNNTGLGSGVSRPEDIPSYARIFQTKDTFQSASVEDRAAALQQLEIDMAKEQGRAPRQLVFEPMDEGDCGAYTFDDGKIHLNSGYLFDPEARFDAMSTVVHEGRHAQQHDYVCGRLPYNRRLEQVSEGSRYEHMQRPLELGEVDGPLTPENVEAHKPVSPYTRASNDGYYIALWSERDARLFELDCLQNGRLQKYFGNNTDYNNKADFYRRNLMDAYDRLQKECKGLTEDDCLVDGEFNWDKASDAYFDAAARNAGYNKARYDDYWRPTLDTAGHRETWNNYQNGVQPKANITPAALQKANEEQNKPPDQAQNTSPWDRSAETDSGSNETKASGEQDIDGSLRPDKAEDQSHEPGNDQTQNEGQKPAAGEDQSQTNCIDDTDQNDSYGQDGESGPQSRDGMNNAVQYDSFGQDGDSRPTSPNTDDQEKNQADGMDMIDVSDDQFQNDSSGKSGPQGSVDVESDGQSDGYGQDSISGFQPTDDPDYNTLYANELSNALQDSGPRYVDADQSDGEDEGDGNDGMSGMPAHSFGSIGFSGGTAQDDYEQPDYSWHPSNSGSAEDVDENIAQNAEDLGESLSGGGLSM